MLISQERLHSLKEQKEYLEEVWNFAYARNIVRLGKAGVENDSIEAEAIVETDIEFSIAGMDIAQNRINLEIDFLKDYLS
jgi:hypothetical protein